VFFLTAAFAFQSLAELGVEGGDIHRRFEHCWPAG
jgi:hypothetical protein